MNNQDEINYKRIETAIGYLSQNFKSQPDLEEIAEKVNLSPFHFQKMFTDWAGISPKKFLQYISIGHAKTILQNNTGSLFDTAFETGLSGTSRLQDLFIKIEGMTPGEFKNGGQNLLINYSFDESPFGKILIASTSKGICYLAFPDDENNSIDDLKSHFPNANFKNISDSFQKNALYIFTNTQNEIPQIKLHLKGTDFQIKVWEALLKIPSGKLSTYKEIACKINNPDSSRAVGSAIGSNPVAFLIPCHRVILSTGIIGQYHWGINRKTAMIGWEAAKENLTATID